MYWGAYEPRVGLTWKVLGSDKTVLRLGFGIYHDSSWNQGAQGLWQNPPNLGESDTLTGRLPFTSPYCAITLDSRIRHSLPADLPPSHYANRGRFTGSLNYEPHQLPAGQSSPI